MSGVCRQDLGVSGLDSCCLHSCVVTIRGNKGTNGYKGALKFAGRAHVPYYCSSSAIIKCNEDLLKSSEKLLYLYVKVLTQLENSLHVT